MSKLNKKYKYHKIEISEIETINYYADKGWHKKDKEPFLKKYKIKLKFTPALRIYGYG